MQVHRTAPPSPSLPFFLSARARFAELERQIPRGFRGQVRESAPKDAYVLVLVNGLASLLIAWNLSKQESM